MTVSSGSATSVGRRFDELYERHGTPLEADHLGQYLAVSPDGRTVLGPDLLDVACQAKEQLGPGCFLYKIGERAVGAWR